MQSVTYYQDGMTASGLTASQCRARFGYYCASNHYRLGTRLLVSRAGRRVVVTVVDRIGRGSDCDLSPGAMRKLAGPKYKVIGRVNATVTSIGTAWRGEYRAKKGRRHHAL